MAQEIDLSNQRPAEYIFENMVKRFMEEPESAAASKERGREKSGAERSDAA
jgi:hypothetical protein